MAPRRISWALPIFALALAVPFACKKNASTSNASSAAASSASASADPSTVALSALASASAVPTGPVLASVAMQTWVHEQPSKTSSKLGYLRAGAIVGRADAAAGKAACPEGWYAIKPAGYVCIGDQATLDLEHPIVRATKGRRPDLTKPMPYRYAFVRSNGPLYLKVPTDAEQHTYEFKLDNHLKYYAKHWKEWSEVTPGANDVPPELTGAPITSKEPVVANDDDPAPAPSSSSDDDDAIDAAIDPPDDGKASTELSLLELFGADGPDDAIPWWLENGKRAVPQLSAFVAPKGAVIAGRVRRHTGFALIGAFHGGGVANNRDFGVLTDLRLFPLSKLKANVGSQWHGVELTDDFTLPIAFAHDFSKDAKGQTVPKTTPVYKIDGDKVTPSGTLVFRQAVALTGKDRAIGDARYFETKDGRWLNKKDIIIARKPDADIWPKDFAKGSQKWIDLAVIKQTLVLYEGDKPVFATLVSTGQDGIGDPETTKSTVRGTFKIREKHVTTTMDANEVDNKFELRDVPWVQYFEKGYALHAAYWHDEYGTPRSHGCVNLSPIDARRLFFWTDPQLPPGWHAVYASDETGKGTIVYSHI